MHHDRSFRLGGMSVRRESRPANGSASPSPTRLGGVFGPLEPAERPWPDAQRDGSAIPVRPSLQLASLWDALTSGRWQFRRTHCAAGRCFAIIAPGSGKASPARATDILKRILTGELPKGLADEYGLGASRISVSCTGTLEAFGSHRRLARAPIVLVMAAWSSKCDLRSAARFEGMLSDEAAAVFSVRVPGEQFRKRLTHAEWQVARLTIEGHSQEHIIRSRRSASRTVINQLASVFKKLKVSGRSELRARAIDAG